MNSNRINRNLDNSKSSDKLDIYNQEISFIDALSNLGTRECEILHLVGSGFTANEISTITSLSVHTVRTHIKNIKSKLKLSGHRSLIHWYKHNQKID